jgi:DNA-binding NarL/FixJ family response regulator
MRRRHSFGTMLIGKSSLLREGLARILRAANFRILASVPCADDLPTSKIQRHQALLLIVHTGDDFCATVEQIKILKDRHPDGRLAVVADHYRPNELASAFRAGVTGYFVDVMSCDVFIKSIELVMMGESVFPPALLSFALDPDGDHLEEAAPRDDNSQAILAAAEDEIAPQLSPREKSILRCLIEGDSNKSIARKIDIAEATVKVHVKAILRKIRVHNRTQAAIWGMNNGSLARRTNADTSSHAPVPSRRLPAPVETISEINQTDESKPSGATGRDGDNSGVPRFDRLVRRDRDPLRR